MEIWSDFYFRKIIPHIYSQVPDRKQVISVILFYFLYTLQLDLLIVLILWYSLSLYSIYTVFPEPFENKLCISWDVTPNFFFMYLLKTRTIQERKAVWSRHQISYPALCVPAAVVRGHKAQSFLQGPTSFVGDSSQRREWLGGYSKWFYCILTASYPF